jgi:hypothetical protein
VDVNSRKSIGMTIPLLRIENMAKPKKQKGLLILPPEDSTGVDGKREYRVIYSIDVRSNTPEQACAEALKVLSDQINGCNNPGVFPPVFQVVDSRGRVVTVDFGQ